jgi:hypothetical protein
MTNGKTYFVSMQTRIKEQPSSFTNFWEIEVLLTEEEKEEIENLLPVSEEPEKIHRVYSLIFPKCVKKEDKTEIRKIIKGYKLR